jgi:hypothetical protein
MWPVFLFKDGVVLTQVSIAKRLRGTWKIVSQTLKQGRERRLGGSWERSHGREPEHHSS